jgi:hypothetical protein
MDQSGPVSRDWENRELPPAVRFTWIPDNAVKCIFVPREEKDEKIIAELVKRHAQVNRVLGGDISFTLIFPWQKGKDGRPIQKPIAELLKSTKLKPEEIARNHSDWKTVAELCSAFDIPFRNLPALIVMVKEVIDKPIVLPMPREITVSEVADWLVMVRDATDEFAKPPLREALRDINERKQKVATVSAKFESDKKNMISAISAFQTRFKLSALKIEPLIALVSTPEALAEFDSKFDEMLVCWELLPKTRLQKTDVVTLRQAAAKLEKSYSSRSQIDVSQLRDISDLLKTRTEELIRNIEAIPTRSAQTKFVANASRTVKGLGRSMPGNIGKLASMVRQIERLLVVLGIA